MKGQLNRGDKVDLIANEGETYATCKVADALASQFTVKVKGKTRFFFYADRGLTWKQTKS